MAFKFSEAAYRWAMMAEEYRIKAQRDYLDAQNAFNKGFYSYSASCAMFAWNCIATANACQKNAESTNGDLCSPFLRIETFADTNEVAEEQLKITDEIMRGA